MNDARSDTELRFLTIGALLERGVDLDTILRAMVDEVVGRLGADRGTLYLVDRPRQQIFSKAAHLPEIEEIRLDVGQGIAGTVAAQDAVIRLPNSYGDPRFERTVDEHTGYQTRSMLAAPIHDTPGALIGVLQVLNKRRGEFDAADEATITALARRAGEILEKTSLYDQLRARPRAETAAFEYRYNCIVGTSAAMRQVYELVDKAAATSATVILMGESGTGKGLMARAVHLNSDRRDRPFITVDCTTLPPSLIENELFGHERGAFTGADQAVQGKFELADGGTVFIDEIGDLPPELQGKLLRVIQERECTRVGGTRPIRVDFRLLAATNRDLDAMVAEGSFREDLYYRIRVVPILLPPLRRRGREDIRRLADHFLQRFGAKHHRPVRGFTAAALQRLLAYEWPGNIRQLENCIESAVVLADGAWIDEPHLTLPPRRGGAAASAAPDLSRTLAQAEHDYVRAVLADCGGNQSEAARRLGISRNTLARKLGARRG